MPFALEVKIDLGDRTSQSNCKIELRKGGKKKTIWKKVKLAELTAVRMWITMGWTCDARPNAVQATLKHACAIRSLCGNTAYLWSCVTLGLHLTFHCFQFRRQTKEFSMDRFHGLRYQVDEIRRVGAHKIGWHKDYHHAVRKEKGGRRTCAERQVRDSTDQALVPDQSADHKCMPDTL